MDEDPHVHVEWNVPNTSADVRAVTASVFGLVGDAPTTVRTGCGADVPYAATSARPDRVTCLPCRDHARERHLRYAAMLETSGVIPAADPGQAASVHAAARRLREVADQFGT